MNKNLATNASSAVASPRRSAFGFHLGLVTFVTCYFGGLLFWFGRLFVTGGAEEHVVMSLIIPVVSVLGLVAVLGLLLIALEGRRVGDLPAPGGSPIPTEED